MNCKGVDEARKGSGGKGNGVGRGTGGGGAGGGFGGTAWGAQC